MKREATLPPVSPPKAALSEEELEKKSKAIIEEYLHLNDMKVGSRWGLSDSRAGGTCAGRHGAWGREQTVTALSLLPAPLQEAVQCVQELASPSLLFIFVRHGIESTLERSTIAREHMGRLLHQLLLAGHLSTAQYYQGYAF